MAWGPKRRRSKGRRRSINIAAFDPGSGKIGVAWALGASTPHWDHFVFPEHIGADLHWFQKELRLYLHGLCTTYAPDLVVYESPIHYAHDAVLIMRKVHIVGGFLELYFGDKGVETQEIMPGPPRTRFLGEGNVPRRRPEIKDALVKECGRRGWHVDTDDEADALCLLDYARIEHGVIAGATMPLFEQEARHGD